MTRANISARSIFRLIFEALFGDRSATRLLSPLRALSPLILAALALIAPMGPAQAVEQARYKVVRAEGDFELRDYPALVVAETVERGDRRAASNPAFRRLAGYIFNDDRPEGEIAMTAPVLMAPKSGSRTSMSFVMPRKYRLSDLPKPADAGVRLRVLPARRVAAIRFRGWAGDADLAEKEAELRAWMARRGIKPLRRAEWAFYNPPWTLGPWRRNEVLIPVRR